MNTKLLSILKSCFFILAILMPINVYAQYYIVYPASNRNPDCVYCYQLHDTISRTYEGGSYRIETYYTGFACPCSRAWMRCGSNACHECADPWQCNQNDNLYSHVSYYYDNEDETYDEDGRTADDVRGDLQINDDT